MREQTYMKISGFTKVYAKIFPFYSTGKKKPVRKSVVAPATDVSDRLLYQLKIVTYTYKKRIGLESIVAFVRITIEVG
jgi:hypothetical protein